jgi:RNA polymerase sigma factor for flagellar operon FliA
MTLKDKKNKLICDYMPYAQKQANIFVTKYNIENYLDDFVSIAYLGLCKAAKKYRFSRKHNFAHFAAIYIIGAMLDEFRKMDLLTKSERKAKIAGESDTHLQLVSIDEEQTYDYNTGESYTIADMLESDDIGLDEHIQKQEALQKIQDAVCKLPKQEQLVFCLYMNNNYTTYKEIGHILGMSEARVSQLLHKAKELIKGDL